MIDLKRYFAKFKHLLSSGNDKPGKKKKMVENAVILIIIGIIIIIAGSTFFANDSKNSIQTPAASEDNTESEVVSKEVEEFEDLEKKMEDILSKIKGAGKVEVAITYSYGKELVPAYDSKQTSNNTTEKDSEGGTRESSESSTENSIAYEEVQGGTKKAIILKEKQPEVKGVVVVAEGASDISVKESICAAVQALVDIPIHKIQVFDSN